MNIVRGHRGSGKTTHAIRIATEHPHSILVVMNEAAKRSLIEQYDDLDSQRVFTFSHIRHGKPPHIKNPVYIVDNLDLLVAETFQYGPVFLGTITNPAWRITPL